ncbi:MULTISPECIES: metallophosphoesterase [unclassified Flagellimonas]|uniref:Metallophosphoesterase n=1 Tax=Flagellimonas sp. MMG031 TaxID=3158549 RepID=A0AAU7N3C9_9FLAO
MATIQYLSDLHLEFPENKQFIQDNPIRPNADILVMAGDIVMFSLLDKFDWFFDDLSQKFQQVYWIPGNHEYYGSDIKYRTGNFKEKIRDNIYLLNNQTVLVDDVELIFTTLWTQLSDKNQKLIIGTLSDFRTIRNNGQLLTTSDYNSLNQDDAIFLRKTLQKNNKQKVVITHHVPTFYNYPKKYLGDPLNEAFAIELEDLIKTNGPHYWIFGHHHSNTEPFKMGSTTLTTNQLGYVQMGEHIQFSYNSVISL